MVRLVFLGILLNGCQHASPLTATPILFSDLPEAGQEEVFQEILKQASDADRYERAKIEYLLGRLSDSQIVFIRNGEEYSSKRGAIHLKWKCWRQRKKIKTAQAFVDNIGSKSKRSGQSYQVKMSGGGLIPSQVIFRNELDYLEQALARRQEEDAKGAVQRKVDKRSENQIESLLEFGERSLKEDGGSVENSLE